VDALPTLVLYDIPGNKQRKRISDACLDYGLERIQKSAFLGYLSRNRREELQKRLSHELGQACGRIEVFPLRDMELLKSWHLVR